MIHIYTDGSCRGLNTDKCCGAWGFAVFDGDELIYKAAAGVRDTTNQRMEIQAITEACKWAMAKWNGWQDVTVYSDSAYCVNCVQQRWYDKWQANGWRTSNNGDVKNKDLWEKLIPYFNESMFRFVKVKGHADVAANCMVDEMVQEITASMIGGK